MRILKASLITAIFVAFILAGSTYAADTKIGVFNFDEIMKESKIGKSAKATLEKKHKSLKAGLEKKKNELESMDEKLEKDRLVMGKAKYEEKKIEIQKKAIDFRELEMKSNDEIRKLQQELIGGINKKIIEIVNTIGKKEKYDIIVEKNMAGVAFYTKQVDLTDRIVKELNR